MSKQEDRFTDWDDPEATGVTNPQQCQACRHYRNNATCSAFPNGIPIIILQDEHDHRKPYPGDRGIRFSPKDTNT